MASFRPLMADISFGVWGNPANFNGFCILPLLLQRHRSPEANRTLHDVWPSPWVVHYIYIFWGSCPITEFSKVQNSLHVQVLRSAILAALLHGPRAVGMSQTLWRGTRNGITELSHRVPTILNRVTIMLGITPHSSLLYLFTSAKIFVDAGSTAVDNWLLNLLTAMSLFMNYGVWWINNAHLFMEAKALCLCL